MCLDYVRKGADTRLYPYRVLVYMLTCGLLCSPGSRQACPLANTKYATVREQEGGLFATVRHATLLS